MVINIGAVFNLKYSPLKNTFYKLLKRLLLTLSLSCVDKGDMVLDNKEVGAEIAQVLSRFLI
jgi:hypothetical protein